MGAWSTASAIAVTVVLLVPAAFAASAQADIQPGDAIVEGDTVMCTLGFAFEGERFDAGRSFFGTAAHCVDDVGERVSVRNVGEIGTVVHRGDPDSVRSDFALIEVDEEIEHRVNPAVRGHPNVPIGIARPADTDTGELVGLYGWGTGFAESETTRSERKGILISQDRERVRAEVPIAFGDSGGPWFSNRLALALTTGLQASVQCCTSSDVSAHAHGPTVQNVIQSAGDAGLTIDLDHVE